MIVILPTTTGYVVGSVSLRQTKRKKEPTAYKTKPGILEHLGRIREWMRLSKRHAN